MNKAMAALLAAACLLSWMALPAVGALGEENSLTQASAAPATEAMLTPTPQPDQTPEPTAEMLSQAEMEAAGLGERILMRGVKGGDVSLMQQRLFDLGYYTGEVDGVFGRQTRTAVMDFQRAHALEKVDGKAGPETLGMMFSDQAIVHTTPTPVPTATPEATPAPTATPDIAGAPFAMESMEMTVAGEQATLMVGRDEEGKILYPLCGLLERMGYEYALGAGSWQLTREEDGREIALMTSGETGLCEGAMGAADGVVFLTDEQSRVYAYGGEAYVTAPLLAQLGFAVEATTAPVITQNP